MGCTWLQVSKNNIVPTFPTNDSYLFQWLHDFSNLRKPWIIWIWIPISKPSRICQKPRISRLNIAGEVQLRQDVHVVAQETIHLSGDFSVDRNLHGKAMGTLEKIV